MPDSPPPTGERRLLSLLFADLAGSGELAATLDPEDLREIYRRTREIAFAAVAKYGGRVKDFFGDGVLAYFGYPMAVERGAQAAVNAGLEMVEAVAAQRWPGRPVRMRVGIHTGEVLIGDIGQAGGAHEADAVIGAALIVANRVQMAAPENSVLISEVTHQLVEGQFRCRDLGRTLLKGVADPMRLYEVSEPAPVQVQIERIATRHIRPLVGRAAELHRLWEAWRSARGGGRACVSLRGEAGIGKSRLMAELKAMIRVEQRGVVWEFQCSPYHTATPFFAVAHVLGQRVFSFAESDSAARRLEKLRTVLDRCGLRESDGEWLLAELLALPFPEAELSASLAPEARKRRRFDVLSRLFLALGGDRTALFEINDAHWIDASTAEWLADFHRHQPAHTLLVITTRPDAAVCEAVKDAEVVALGGLGAPEIEQLARAVAGGRILPNEVLTHLAETCGGVPLFVEELTSALLTSGALNEQEHHYELKDWSPARQLPISLRDLLQSRLDQLDPADRAVVQACAVVRTEAPPHIVSRVLDEPDPARTEAALERLTTAGFLARGANGFAIRHALIANAAYEALVKSARTRLHVRVAELLQAGALDGHASPALVAEHFALAGLPSAAVPLWLQAAQLALRRSAHAEAVALARRGIEAIEHAGESSGLREAHVQLTTTLGIALVSSKGFASPDALAAFHRAERLLGDAGDPATRFPVVWGLGITHLMRGQLDRALHYSTRMLEIGRAVPGGSFLVEALWMHADVLFWLGRLDEAERHLDEALATYRPEHHANAHRFGQDPAVAARVYLMQLHTFRLRAREAVDGARECLEFARTLRHPHSLVWAMASDMMVKLLLGDVDGTLASGPEAIEYCMKQEHPFWLSAVKMMMGWALAQKGRAADGLRMAREGFALYEQLGTSLIAPVFCALLADCCAAARQHVEAATWVARARKTLVENNEQLSRPAVALVAGQLLESDGNLAQAEASYREALDCAKSQGALLREVQAAAMLARLLAAQGRSPEAGAVLMPYGPVVMAPDAPAFLRPLAGFLAAAADGPA